MTPAFVWKVVLTAALAAAILASALARAPRRPVPLSDLRVLVVAAMMLYAVGLVAALNHRSILAALVYCSGIGTSALAVWLSRASGRDDPPHGGDDGPEPGPSGPGGIDWTALERQFGDYSPEREPLLPSSSR
jgi:hypothetical protein